MPSISATVVVPLVEVDVEPEETDVDPDVEPDVEPDVDPDVDPDVVVGTTAILIISPPERLDDPLTEVVVLVLTTLDGGSWKSVWLTASTGIGSTH